MNLKPKHLPLWALLCCSLSVFPQVVIAKGTWQATGSMAAGCSASIRALAVTPSNDQAYWLFALPLDGLPVLCGNVQSSLIMGMDLSDNSFFSLGAGLPDPALALYVTDDFVYVATYESAPDSSYEITTIRRWDGQSWSVIGAPQRGEVLAITEYQGALHIAISPDFDEGYVKRFDGSDWVSIGGKFNARVSALAAGGNDLYVGGEFNAIDAVSGINGMARFNGSQWAALGDGLEPTVAVPSVRVEAIEVAFGDVYVTGLFAKAGGQTVNHIARWDGSQWFPLGSGLSSPGDDVVIGESLAFDGQTLYVGGDFFEAGGQPASMVAKWNGNAWSKLGQRGINIDLFFGITGMALVGNQIGSDLLVGGGFSTADGQLALNLALWDQDQNQWQVFPGQAGQLGLSPFSEIAVFQNKLHVSLSGGLFRLDPSGWAEVVDANGLGVDGAVLALLSTDNTLYIGGDFLTAGGQTVNHVTTWDGTSFGALGSGSGAGVRDGFFRASVLALALDGNDLYVGGDFTKAGGLNAGYVARWDGTAWSGLYSGGKSIEHEGTGWVSDIVIVPNLEVPGSDVYFSGTFESAGGQVANNIARWDGSQWHVLTDGSRVGVGDAVIGLHVFDGAIHVATGFTFAAIESLRARVERWVMADSKWQSVGEVFSGELDQPLGLFDYGGDLYVFGNLTNYEGQALRHLARWTGSKWVALGSGEAAGPDGLVFQALPDATGFYVAGVFKEVDGKVSSGWARFVPALFWDSFEE